MYVIIFSIDKNYGVCWELKNGVGGFKKSPQFCGAGSRLPLRTRSSLSSRIQGQIRRIETRMTPGEAGGKEGTMNFKPQRGATNHVFSFATFGAQKHILSKYPGLHPGSSGCSLFEAYSNPFKFEPGNTKGKYSH